MNREFRQLAPFATNAEYVFFLEKVSKVESKGFQ